MAPARQRLSLRGIPDIRQPPRRVVQEGRGQSAGTGGPSVADQGQRGWSHRPASRPRIRGTASLRDGPTRESTRNYRVGHRLVERVLPRQLELISRLMTTLTRAEADALEGLLSRVDR